MLLYVREIALRRVLQFVSVLIFVCVTSTSNALALTDPGDWWFNSYDTSNGGQMLSTKQIDWCYSNMDKRQSSEVSAIGLIQNVLNDCVNPAKKGPCSVLLLDQSNPSKGTEYTCDVSRTSESEPIAKAINESIVNEPNQLVALLCGTAVTDSQAEAIRPCAKAVRKAYYTPACYYHNGRDSKDGTATDQFTATCVYNAVKSNPVIRFMKPVAAIKDAISQGRKGTQDAIDGALKDVASKNDCEKSGGTWKDNKCQQKEDTSTCNIEGGLSWVICPVMNTLASINDTAFSALKNFLEIDAKVITNNDIKGAWEKFRDIANVAFIGAFLIVIYSQMTGTGISNYGIKKIIPRIVVAAVLINISFWVCAVMVDISNIVGSSIYNLLGDSINIGGGDSGHEGWNAVVGGLLTGGIVIALVAALILAPTVLLAVAVVLIILIARQAFVILLIAMSPLAFTAYLLPNTEQWFKKWWKAFVAVLMVYPTVGLVFGASTLASRVLGTSDDKLMQVAALAIMGIPLFAVPALLKGAMSAAGSIGQKLAGLQDRANKRGMRGIKEGRLGEAKAAFDARRASRKINRRLGQGRLAKWGQRGAVEGANGKTVYRSRRAAAAAWLGTRQKALDNSRASNYLGANRGAAAATAAYHKEVNEETERQQATMSEHGADDLLEIAKDTKQTAERRAAALRQLEHVGGHQHIQAAYDYLMQEGAAGGKDVGDVQQLAAKSLLSRRPAGVGKTQANALVNGKMKGEGYNDSLRQRLRDQKFDERSLAAMDVDDIARFAQMKAEGKLTDDDVEMLDSLDQLIKKNPNISMDGEKQHALDQALYGPMNPDGTQAAAPTNTRGSTYQEALIDLNMPSGG